MVKRILLGLLVVFLLLIAVGYFAVGREMLGLAPSVGGTVAPGVERVLDGYVNAFVVDLDEGVALIDCGNDPEAKAILAALKARSLGPPDVKAIFITHGHPDHVAGCKKFPGASVHAFDEDRGLIEGTKAAGGPLPKRVGIDPNKTAKVSHLLVDGQPVSFGSVAVTAWKIPGHTQGSAAIVAREVLFTGDSAAIDAEGKLRVAPWIFSDDVPTCAASLVALSKKLPPSVTHIAPAHSGAAQGLQALLDFAKNPGH